MSAIPDAWDDDWESAADKQLKAAVKPAPEVLSRAERKARHAEANKQLWESAERPEKFHFVEARSDVPLKDEFKPQLKVLSRKPAPKVASRGNGINGIGGLSIDDEDDSEEEARKKNEASLAERQRKAAEEREEKQRKYAEVRERLFGSATPRDGPGKSTGAPRGSGSSDSKRSSRGGRVQSARGSQPGSSAEQSPARTPGQSKQLFDPNYTAKTKAPDSRDASRSGTPKDNQPVRMPKGPDSSGREGFGFAARGGRTGA